MIGHYVDQLAHEQEDAVLVTRLICGARRGDNPGAGDYWRRGAACLVGAAEGRHRERPHAGLTEWGSPNPFTFDDAYVALDVETRYDVLVRRFGARRIAAAIRTRILSNRARRTLGAPRAEYGDAVTERELYAAHTQHQATCPACNSGALCFVGWALFDAWGASDAEQQRANIAADEADGCTPWPEPASEPLERDYSEGARD